MKTLLLMAGVLTMATLAAQQTPPAPAGTPSPAFEVTSVKRNTSGDGFISISLAPTRPTFINVPVRQLIVRAYGVQAFQVLGGPAWIGNDRFDITAKAPDTAHARRWQPYAAGVAVRSLQVEGQRETRQSDVYRLVKARAGRQAGRRAQTRRC